MNSMGSQISALFIQSIFKELDIFLYRIYILLFLVNSQQAFVRLSIFTVIVHS